jgi:uncharacterized protein (TIGR03437 family)
MRVLVLGTVTVISLLAQQQPAIRLNRLASGVSQPTDIQNCGDGTGRLFFVQQDGLIRIFKNGALLPSPFLDIRDRTRPGGERGLLGLAFPPKYFRKQYFYVDYTDLTGTTTIARYRTTANPDVADPQSEQILLTINQPFANHNGGQLRFGPDGYLYIGMGDGGSANDPLGNGQNPNALLGKILRMDVESNVNAQEYIPEIWAIGLRNPWRFSFDRTTGDLWIADVGQDRYEEVDFQPASSPGGENYGWNIMEGLHCLRPGCSMDGLTLPIVEYSHADGCSVTGGFVYRGARSPSLQGTFIYGDYCSGKIWGVRREGGQWVNRLLLESGLTITTFGEDEAGEIYVADQNGGAIDAITAPGTINPPSFSSNSVVNAASSENGIVPGSAATIYATGLTDSEGIVAADRIPLPTLLSGVSVTVNGLPAPLYAVAKTNGVEQVNIQVPFEVEGEPTAAIVVTRSGAESAPVEVPVFAAQPGILTTNGTDAVVVHWSDNTLVTPQKPLQHGELAYFYTTGMGPVENNPGTGNAGPLNPLARTLSPPVVALGGLPADVLFAGLAPGLVGVFQINIQTPAEAPAGSADLVVTINGAPSRPARVSVQ